MLYKRHWTSLDLASQDPRPAMNQNSPYSFPAHPFADCSETLPERKIFGPQSALSGARPVHLDNISFNISPRLNNMTSEKVDVPCTCHARAEGLECDVLPSVAPPWVRLLRLEPMALVKSCTRQSLQCMYERQALCFRGACERGGGRAGARSDGDRSTRLRSQRRTGRLNLLAP